MRNRSLVLATAALALGLAVQPARAQSGHEAHHPPQAPSAEPGTTPQGMPMMQGPMMEGMMGQQMVQHPAPGVTIIINTFQPPGMTGHQGMPMEQGMPMDHGMMQGQPRAASPSSEAFARATAQMHEAMNVPLTGDADVDFVRSMIPHHQGAIDMAKIVLAYGKDPEIRALANAVVEAQEKEVAMMKDWLAKHR